MTSNTDLAQRLTESAVSIRNDGTPAQVGLTADECDAAASTILSLSSQVEELTRELQSRSWRLDEETAIVTRIWSQLGNPSYAELAGRSIYDLIDELKARAETAEARVAALSEALTQCADRLERCAILGGTTPEYAAIAVEAYRNALSGTGK